MVDLEELETSIKGTMLQNEPLSRHTSLGIGGPTRAFIYPADENDLRIILRFANSNDIHIYFAGSGSNLLVSDDGFSGFVICLSKHFRQLKFEGTHVFAQSGTMIGHFVKECINHNLKGVESLIGIPGTLGGALKMNAGAYGHEISNFLKFINVMTITGEKKQYRKEDIDFGYRYSSIPETEVILSAEFDFERGIKEEIQSQGFKASAKRKSTQPLRFRSAGSVFKNPPYGKPAGYLIDRAGLKGLKRGGAEISLKHANFIVNHGDATADDIVWLIRQVRKTVEEKFNISLQLEIKTLGFPEGYFYA